jgi:hypothetical protein
MISEFLSNKRVVFMVILFLGFMFAILPLHTFIFAGAATYIGGYREYLLLSKIAFLLPFIITSIVIGIILGIPFGFIFHTQTIILALLAVSPILLSFVPWDAPGQWVPYVGHTICVLVFVVFAWVGCRWYWQTRVSAVKS